MEKIATDIYSFSELRGQGFTSVDKRVAKLGLAFSSEKRTVTDMKTTSRTSQTSTSHKRRRKK